MVKDAKDKSFDSIPKQQNKDILFEMNQPAKGEHSLND